MMIGDKNYLCLQGQYNGPWYRKSINETTELGFWVEERKDI